MLARQKGKTIEEVIEIRNNFDNPLGRKIIGSMIVPAYNVSRKETQIEQMLEAVSFGDDKYKECLTEMINN